MDPSTPADPRMGSMAQGQLASFCGERRSAAASIRDAVVVSASRSSGLLRISSVGCVYVWLVSAAAAAVLLLLLRMMSTMRTAHAPSQMSKAVGVSA